MRKLVIIVLTCGVLMACNEQATDLHARVERLEEQVQRNENLLTVLDINAQAHQRHLKRLDRQLDDAALGIPDLRTR